MALIKKTKYVTNLMPALATLSLYVGKEVGGWAEGK